MAIPIQRIWWPSSAGPQYKYIKHPHQRESYNNLMSLLRKLGIRSAKNHPVAIYIPGIY